jgi:hypothetical protein
VVGLRKCRRQCVLALWVVILRTGVLTLSVFLSQDKYSFLITLANINVHALRVGGFFFKSQIVTVSCTTCG